MLFPARYWPGLEDGSITVAFRRQKRPTVKAGGTLNSRGGLLSIDEVAAISEADITDADARAAGCADRDEILAALKADGTLYRFRFHRIGDDPRKALRADDAISDEDLVMLRKKLARLDWAADVLRVIRDHPEVVSTELAPQVGMERPDFKLKVRRLKALGLTESLLVGYRLSPRGLAVLRSVFGDD
ncbi:MAG: hypothetical protein QOJ00_633 [Actinomycetota bacterium]|jgi:hypothetical protein